MISSASPTGQQVANFIMWSFLFCIFFEKKYTMDQYKNILKLYFLCTSLYITLLFNGQ